MHIVTATFVTNHIPDWPDPVLSESVPLGKQYRIDLDTVCPLTMEHRASGRTLIVDAVLVLDPFPGWLPLGIFSVPADQ